MASACEIVFSDIELKLFCFHSSNFHTSIITKLASDVEYSNDNIIKLL